MSRSSVSMVFELFDSATGAARPFASLEPGHAKIYVCGLTVQSEPHVGHVRSAVNFDVLRRWLVALGYRVTFIRNVTDVDDKIFVKAAELGQPWFQLAYDMRRELDRLLTLVNVLPPRMNQPPRLTFLRFSLSSTNSSLVDTHTPHSMDQLTSTSMSGPGRPTAN